MNFSIRNSKKLIVFISEELMLNDEDLLIIMNFWRSSNIRNETLLCKLWKIRRIMTPKILQTERWLTEYYKLQFFQLFRMTRNTYDKFGRTLRQVDKDNLLCKRYTGGHYPIDLNGHCLIFLWYMATQDTLISIGSRFSVCPKTVMDIVNRMLYLVLQLKNLFIKFPKTEEELTTVANAFKNYPGVIGAVDGSHIFIKVEKEQQDSYIDRYRRTSINLMAICDANTLFTYVFVGFPGSAHDSRVFENSTFFKNIERYGAGYYFDDTKYHLIGDTAFTLRKWLMKPYQGDNLTRTQRHHNFRLSSERVAIEHCFGGYKGRWRRVQYINTYNIFKAVEIAMTACVLHNFCILNGDLWDDMCLDINVNIANADEENVRRGNAEALLKRDTISTELFRNR